MMVLVECPECMMCGKSAELEVDDAALAAWRRDTHIQDAFPDMTPDERELLITGTHPKCWDAMMGPES
jgi:hypothetical protein